MVYKAVLGKMGNTVSSPSNHCVQMAASCGADPYDYLDGREWELPKELVYSLKFLTYEQIELCRRLCEMGQDHLFHDWVKISPKARQAFCQRLQQLDKLLPRGELEPLETSVDSVVPYDGGLVAYIEKIRDLLHFHRSGRDCWRGWHASAPMGATLKLGDEDFDIAEQQGCRLMGRVAFVLNAWEKGSDALLKMPVELLTGTSYLQLYIQHIRVVEQRFGSGRKLPLCILTSKETHQPIQQFLDENDRFGMDPSQVKVLVPEFGVPVVVTPRGDMATDPENPSELYTLPEGEGCIHALLHNAGITKDWIKKGIQFVYFFRGANSLALQALPYMLSVSKKDKLILNYLAVPRKTDEPSDAIVSLSRTSEHEGSQRTMRIIDHSELNSFLDARVCTVGDVSDDTTDDSSPYPTATHTMLIQLESYHEVLERSGGELPGYLEPLPSTTGKKFAQPVRIASRLADICLILSPEESDRIGVTLLEADCFHAPAKSPMQSAATAEIALYNFHRRILRKLGCQIEESDEENGFNPCIALHPSFCLTVSDYKDKFPDPESVIISKRSTMIVKGFGAKVSSLSLDGCVVIHCQKGFHLNVEGKVWNLGWQIVREETHKSETTKTMRGLKVLRLEEKEVNAGEAPGLCSIL